MRDQMFSRPQFNRLPLGCLTMMFFITLLGACSGGSSSSSSDAPNATAAEEPTPENTATSLVFRSNTATLCDSSQGLSAEQSAETLRTAGIDVIETSCGRFVSPPSETVGCEISTGEINIHKLPTQSLNDAEVMGYSPLTALADAGSQGYEAVNCTELAAPSEDQTETTALVHQKAVSADESVCPLLERPLSEGVQQLGWLGIETLQASCGKLEEGYRDACINARTDINVFRINKVALLSAAEVGLVEFPENENFDLTACTPNRRAAAGEPTETNWVYIRHGGRQCESTGETLADSKLRLNNLSIPTQAESCGSLTDFFLAAVCGGSTSGINLFQVKRNHLNQALSAGFSIVHNDTKYQFGDCPADI